MIKPRPSFDSLNRRQDAARGIPHSAERPDRQNPAPDWKTHIDRLRHTPPERVPNRATDLAGDPLRQHRAKGDAGQRLLLALLRKAAFWRGFHRGMRQAVIVAYPIGAVVALAVFTWRHWK